MKSLTAFRFEKFATSLYMSYFYAPPFVKPSRLSVGLGLSWHAEALTALFIVVVLYRHRILLNSILAAEHEPRVKSEDVLLRLN